MEEEGCFGEVFINFKDALNQKHDLENKGEFGEDFHHRRETCWGRGGMLQRGESTDINHVERNPIRINRNKTSIKGLLWAFGRLAHFWVYFGVYFGMTSGCAPGTVLFQAGLG